MGLFSFLTAVGIGAGLMYLLDPQAGERRRTQVAEQVKRRTKTAREETARVADDAQQQAADLTEGALP